MPLGYSSIVGQSQADYQGYEIYAGNEGFKIPHRHLYSSVHLLEAVMTHNNSVAKLCWILFISSMKESIKMQSNEMKSFTFIMLIL